MSNPFFNGNDDAVDDDEFLNHPKSGSGGYMLPGRSEGGRNGGGGAAATRNAAAPPSGRTPDEQRMMQLQVQREEIERRTLESSNRSLGLLYESERAGQATAEELSRQKEQLKRTEARLDDINSTLTVSERHLQGIKSVFGGIRNYFASRNSAAATVVAGASSSSANANVKPGGTDQINISSKMLPPPTSSRSEPAFANRGWGEDNHPGLRTRGMVEENGVRGANNSSADVDRALDLNLDEMSVGLSRLKGLAQNLNRELDEHNDIIDRLDHKTSNADWRIQKQNKDMDRLLKK